MSDTLVVVDPVPKEEGHSRAYNRSFLEVAVGSRQWSRIVFLSTPEICRLFRSCSWAEAVEFRPQCKRVDPASQGKLRAGVRLIGNYFRAMSVAAESGGWLILTHAEALTLGLALALMPRRWLRRHRVTLVDQLPSYSRKRSLHRRMLRVAFERLFGVVVFERIFREAVRLGRGSGPSRVTVMHTPHHWDLADKAGARQNLDHPRRVHYVGSLRPEKGMRLFPEALRQVAADKGCASRFEVGIFGSVPGDLAQRLPSEEPGITVRDGFLAEEEFIRRFRESHFVLVPHTTDFYPKVSGILMDAIAMGRPVIASDIELHRYYFSEYGPMGMLFRAGDPSDLARVVAATSSVSDEDYERWSDNMDDFRRDRSPEKLQHQLVEAMAG